MENGGDPNGRTVAVDGVDVQIGEAHVNEDNRKEVLKAEIVAVMIKNHRPFVQPFCLWPVGCVFSSSCAARCSSCRAPRLAGGPPPPPEGRLFRGAAQRLHRLPPPPTPLRHHVLSSPNGHPNPLSYRLFLPQLHTTLSWRPGGDNDPDPGRRQYADCPPWWPRLQTVFVIRSSPAAR